MSRAPNMVKDASFVALEGVWPGLMAYGPNFWS